MNRLSPWKGFPLDRLLRGILAFIAPWIAYYVAHGLLLGFPSASWLLPNLLVPSLFLAAAGAVLTLVAFRSESMAMRSESQADRRAILLVVFLVAADQAIKLYLFSTDWKQLSVSILPGFAIAPVLNSYGSYLASILRINIPSALYFALYACVAVLYFEGFRYYMHSGKRDFWSIGAMVLFFSGLLSVFLDNLVHGGSLDYLLIEPLFTCDLKDFYLTFGVIFILVETIEHSLAVQHGESTPETDFRFSDFFQFMKEDIRRIGQVFRRTGRRPLRRRNKST